MDPERFFKDAKNAKATKSAMCPKDPDYDGGGLSESARPIENDQAQQCLELTHQGRLMDKDKAKASLVVKAWRCPQLVRLAGGPTPAEGRVELYYNGSYGTICQIGWDLVDATVVSGQYYTTTPVINVQVRLVGGTSPLEGRVEVICRQLGFSGTSVAFSNAYFGAGSSNQPIWLDDVNCLGTETNVGQCLIGRWGIHNCVHLEDAGVRCSAAGPQLVRLASGPTPTEGRVELYYNGSPYDQKG
eukprot:Em0098g3a